MERFSQGLPPKPVYPCGSVLIHLKRSMGILFLTLPFHLRGNGSLRCLRPYLVLGCSTMLAGHRNLHRERMRMASRKIPVQRPHAPQPLRVRHGLKDLATQLALTRLEASQP